MSDLELLKARFLTCEFNKEDEYLQHYFTDMHRQQLIIYYKIFPYQGNGGIQKFHRNFTDHTGVHCCVRWIYKTLRKFKKIEDALNHATKTMDFETIASIKSGQWLKRKPRSKLRLQS